MSYDDVSKIKVDLIPMIQELMTEWHIIQYLGTTPSESPAIEDFSYKLSSLQIGRITLNLNSISVVPLKHYCHILMISHQD